MNLQKMFPILTESGSDSATLDNMIQFLARQRPQPAARGADGDSRSLAESHD